MLTVNACEYLEQSVAAAFIVTLSTLQFYRLVVSVLTVNPICAKRFSASKDGLCTFDGYLQLI